MFLILTVKISNLLVLTVRIKNILKLVQIATSFLSDSKMSHQHTDIMLAHITQMQLMNFMAHSQASFSQQATADYFGPFC